MCLILVDLPKDRSVLYMQKSDGIRRIFPLAEATAKRGEVLSLISKMRGEFLLYLHKQNVLA